MVEMKAFAEIIFLFNCLFVAVVGRGREQGKGCVIEKLEEA